MIFIDSGFLFILLRSSEKFHSDAVDIFNYYSRINATKVINSVVLIEILNKSKKLNLTPIEIYNAIKTDAIIVPVYDEDLKLALEINKFYNDAINYSDCTIIKTMQDLRINNVLSFDSDFDKINGINRIS